MITEEGSLAVVDCYQFNLAEDARVDVENEDLEEEDHKILENQWIEHAKYHI